MRRLVEAELAADVLVFRGLRLLEIEVRLRETGARVRHRRAENHRIEGIRNVVVVPNRSGVATLRMGPPAVRVVLDVGHCRWPAEYVQPPSCPERLGEGHARRCGVWPNLGSMVEPVDETGAPVGDW